jgi:hypothetical protein
MNKIIFQEYPQDKTILCKGHADLENFKLEALRQFKKSPYKIRQTFRVFRWIKNVKVEGEKTRGYNTYLECDSGTKNAEPITIGYFNV